MPYLYHKITEQIKHIQSIKDRLESDELDTNSDLNNIDSITMYGDQSSKLIESGTQNIDKILKIAKDSLGLDLKSILTAYAGKKAMDNLIIDTTDNSQTKEAMTKAAADLISPKKKNK